MSKKSKVIVSLRREGSEADVYVGVTDTNGKLVNVEVPLDKEIELDENVIKSIKQRQEHIRSNGKNATLVLKPIYLIEKV